MSSSIMIHGAAILRANAYRTRAETRTRPTSQAHTGTARTAPRSAGPTRARRTATASSAIGALGRRRDSPADPLLVGDRLSPGQLHPGLEIARQRGLEDTEGEQVRLAREEPGNEAEGRLGDAGGELSRPAEAHPQHREGQLELVEEEDAVLRVGRIGRDRLPHFSLGPAVDVVRRARVAHAAPLELVRCNGGQLVLVHDAKPDSRPHEEAVPAL